MAEYAITARIEGVRPRLAAPDRRRAYARPWPAFDQDADGADPWADLHPTPVPSLGQRLERAGELWRQVTFYLFDAESWR